MARHLTREHIRAAVGLIAAYAIALQTLLAAFAPLPASAQGAPDFGALSAICFGSGNAGVPGDPDAPAPASGKFHCVVCCFSAGTAMLPQPARLPLPVVVQAEYVSPHYEARVASLSPRTGPARAPPLTV